MSGAFHRTGHTRLTDDELMLFDALFSVWVAPDSLRRQHFREFHNLPYEHGLDDTALEQTLSRLRAAGLVRRKRTHVPATGRVLIWLGLTAKHCGARQVCGCLTSIRGSLDSVQLRVLASARHQLVMGSDFRDPCPLQHDDQARHADRRKTVRHEYR